MSWTQAQVLQQVHQRGEWGRHANTMMNKTFHDPETGLPWQEGQVTILALRSSPQTLGVQATPVRHHLGEPGCGRRPREALPGLLLRPGEAATECVYGVQVGEDLVADLAQLGGVLTMEDLAKYRARWVEPVKVTWMYGKLLTGFFTR